MDPAKGPARVCVRAHVYVCMRACVRVCVGVGRFGEVWAR